MSLGMLNYYWLQVNGVLFTVCVGVCRGGGTVERLQILYIVNEIKDMDGCNKSNIHYHISSYS